MSLKLPKVGDVVGFRGVNVSHTEREWAIDVYELGEHLEVFAKVGTSLPKPVSLAWTAEVDPTPSAVAPIGPLLNRFSATLSNASLHDLILSQSLEAVETLSVEGEFRSKTLCDLLVLPNLRHIDIGARIVET